MFRDIRGFLQILERLRLNSYVEIEVLIPSKMNRRKIRM